MVSPPNILNNKQINSNNAYICSCHSPGTHIHVCWLRQHFGDEHQPWETHWGKSSCQVRPMSGWVQVDFSSLYDLQISTSRSVGRTKIILVTSQEGRWLHWQVEWQNRSFSNLLCFLYFYFFHTFYFQKNRCIICSLSTCSNKVEILFHQPLKNLKRLFKGTNK